MPGYDAKLTSHAIDSDTVKGLVREVIRRLADLDSGEAFTVNEKVITASTIEGLPESQKRFNIGVGAVITPAARDEARRRNISFDRFTTTTQPTKTQLATDVTHGISDTTSPERAASVIEQLRRRGIRLPVAAIVLSETPGRDVFEQCTKHGQRSVMITSLSDVDRFRAEMSPTSWVLDMTRLNLVAATNVAARISQLED